jgi:small subunit ribosomal protein S2
MNQIQNLLNVNLHLGRNINNWHPQMLPYVYSEQNGNHILNVFQIQKLLITAKNFINRQLNNKKNILFVGTKKSAVSVIEKKARQFNQFFVNNYWLPGLLSNWRTTKYQIAKLNSLELEKNNGSFSLLPKKERLLKSKKLFVLNKYLKGIRYMKNLPGAIVIIDPFIEKIALNEAKKLNIKIIGLIDTNTNPRIIDYPIPGNSDSPESINYIIEELFN